MLVRILEEAMANTVLATARWCCAVLAADSKSLRTKKGCQNTPRHGREHPLRERHFVGALDDVHILGPLGGGRHVYSSVQQWAVLPRVEAKRGVQ